MKKNKILLLMYIALFILGCTTSEKKEQNKPLIFSYRILEKKDFFFEKSPDIKFNACSILLNIPDTIVTYAAIAKSAINICKNENIIAARFYKTEECWKREVSSGVIDKEIYNECYIGYIDNTNKGLNWKYKIRIEDFKFNDKEELPMKINVK